MQHLLLIWPGRCGQDLWSEGPEDEVVADEEGGRDDVDDRPSRGGAEVERDGDESSQNGAGEQEFGSSDLIIRNPFRDDLVLLFKKINDVGKTGDSQRTLVQLY